jgi:hypothetical protein
LPALDPHWPGDFFAENKWTTLFILDLFSFLPYHPGMPDADEGSKGRQTELTQRQTILG